ncbi:hypothetical protein D3C76_1067810 [compost metagenome]
MGLVNSCICVSQPDFAVKKPAKNIIKICIASLEKISRIDDITPRVGKNIFVTKEMM